jgi:hypothetical protein
MFARTAVILFPQAASDEPKQHGGHGGTEFRRMEPQMNADEHR